MAKVFELPAFGAVVALAAGSALAAAGTWSPVPVPNAGVRFTSLQAVDGRTDTDAWAVGYVQPPTAAPTYPISLHWNGTAWTDVPVPPQGIGTTLWGVSGSAAGDAWAVGSVSTHPPGYHIVVSPIAMHWTGGAWNPVSVPGSGTLVGVADVGPADAWAVGDTVKHWDGTAWAGVSTPNPGGAGSFTAVAARSADDVWAVGNYSPRRHVTAAFAIHFDGTAWSLVPMPAGLQVWSVTSVSPADAWAVGQLDPATVQDTVQPAMVHWNGTAWSVVAGPPIPGNGGYLRAVSARATGDVWAVGPQLLADTPYVAPLTEHWDGRQWTRPDAPATGVPSLWAVSARPGTTHTWAAGNQTGGVPLILERH
ncbi:hypothetical protein ACQP2F_26785 [Actinoplanes sp. CA-030573]|uniref:hypothetical protein n=1 Tax=Actinoplanes sp. CA-030573 TaxID=3239898 RepID=UPI003D8E6985